MATTITTARDEVKRRLKVGAVTGEPSNTEIEDYVRQAFIELFGVLGCPTETTASVTESGRQMSATVTADRIYFLGKGPRVYLEGIEWSKQGSTVYFDVADLESGMTIWAIVSASPTITIGATAAVTNDSIFAKEWLQEPAIIYACMLTSLEMSRRSVSASSTQHATIYRVLEEGYKAAVEQRRRQLGEWEQRMSTRMTARGQWDPALPPARLAKMVNRSTLVQRLRRSI